MSTEVRFDLARGDSAVVFKRDGEHTAYVPMRRDDELIDWDGPEARAGLVMVLFSGRCDDLVQALIERFCTELPAGRE